MREIKPTQKDAPSSDVKDLFFNSGLLDIWATSLEHKYIDRFGNCHLTAAGMEWLFKELVEKFKVDMNTAIVAAGYITIDSFQQGADLPNNELTQRNHILRDEATGEYYRWDGDLPKQVPAGSTPQSTGGIGKGAWVSVGDATLRSSLAKNDGFSNIGACNSIEELKSILASLGQRVLVNKYNHNEDYILQRTYTYSEKKTEYNIDNGIYVESINNSGGVWVLDDSDIYDARIFGIAPSQQYSDTMINGATQFVKAAVSVNDTIHFALPTGWAEAHYLLNDPYKINFGKCFISADDGVILHIPGTADREGWQPRVKGDVTISEQAPDNQNTFITKRGCNDYDLKAAIASAMVTAGMSIDHAEFPIKLTESVRAIKVDNFTGNATALYSIFNSGLLLSDDAVSWSDANAAGAASAGIELAASEGSEVEVLVSNKGRATLGVVSVGVRSMTADGSIGSFITLRLAINSNEIKIVNGDTVTATYTMEQLPHDYLHASKQTSVRVGVRTHGNGKKTTFLINGKPLHTHTSYSTSTHSIVCLASQEARSGIHFQFLYSRVRDFINYAVPVSICCLGDSITKGSRATNEWPRLIQNYAEHLPGVGKIERLDNFAISGWNSTEVLNDLVNHDFSKYTHVLIQVGTNDCQTANENDISGAMAAYANNITAISNYIKSKSAKCIVIFGVFPKWTNKELSGGGQNTVNLLYTPAFQSTLRWIAQANARDVIFSDDFFGDNYGYKNSFTDMSPYWTNDNIHPNTRGHIALAAAFASGLSKSLSQPSRGAISQILQLKNNFTLHNEHENGLLKVHKVDNVVTISGAVTAGEVGAVITTLPAFARPATSFLSPCLTSIGVATVRVDSAGDISVLVGYAKGNSLDLNITYSI
nr:hypothetical protein [Providencia rettgeri]